MEGDGADVNIGGGPMFTPPTEASQDFNLFITQSQGEGIQFNNVDSDTTTPSEASAKFTEILLGVPSDVVNKEIDQAMDMESDTAVDRTKVQPLGETVVCRALSALRTSYI